MKIEMYEDGSGEWRWRLRAPNGRILCDSAEGYATKPGVRRSIANFAKYLCAAIPVEEVRASRVSAITPVKRQQVAVQRPRARERKGA